MLVKVVHFPFFNGLYNMDNAVEITVRDTGAGIPPEDIGHVFDRPFHTTKREDIDDKFDSSGIGLAFSKKPVELHHGVISAESETGKGSAFTVRLSP